MGNVGELPGGSKLLGCCTGTWQRGVAVYDKHLPGEMASKLGTKFDLWMKFNLLNQVEFQ